MSGESVWGVCGVGGDDERDGEGDVRDGRRVVVFVE